MTTSRCLSLALIAACTNAPVTSDPAELDGCVPSESSDDARGLLAYANDPVVTADEMRGLGIAAADDIVAARPIEDLTALDAVPNLAAAECHALRAQACDVRGLCEPVLPLWTWNIKTFPVSGTTIDHVVATLADAELVGFQEIDSLPAFDQVLARLPGWVGVPGDYGFGTRVVIAFRTDRLKLIATEDLWTDDDDRFPRPVLATTFEIVGRVGASRFTVINVHLKAQIDADSQRRRREAIVILEAWMAGRRAAGDQVIAVGDWNDDIDDPPAYNVFAPILAHPEAYVPLTIEVAKRDGYSYIPFKRLIDHIVMTTEAAQQLQPQSIDPVLLDVTIPSYTQTVSDHRPVAQI